MWVGSAPLAGLHEEAEPGARIENPPGVRAQDTRGDQIPIEPPVSAAVVPLEVGR